MGNKYQLVDIKEGKRRKICLVRLCNLLLAKFIVMLHRGACTLDKPSFMWNLHATYFEYVTLTFRRVHANVRMNEVQILHYITQQLLLCKRIGSNKSKLT